MEDVITNLISLPSMMDKGFRYLHDNVKYVTKNNIRIDCNKKHLSGESYLMNFDAEVITSNLSMTIINDITP